VGQTSRSAFLLPGGAVENRCDSLRIRHAAARRQTGRSAPLGAAPVQSRWRLRRNLLMRTRIWRCC